MDPVSNVLDTVTRLIPTAAALAGVVIGLHLAIAYSSVGSVSGRDAASAAR